MQSSTTDAPERVIEHLEGVTTFVIDCTPGHAPRGAQPVGAQVVVRQSARRSRGWTGVVHGHVTGTDGQFWQIIRVRVTDPCGYMNLRPGLLVDVAHNEVHRPDSTLVGLAGD